VLLLAGLSIALSSLWFALAAIAWGLVTLAAIRWHTRDLNARLHASSRGLVAGSDAAVTARSLEALCHDARTYPLFHSAALFYLSVALARAGELDEAIELMERIHRAGWLRRQPYWSTQFPPWLTTLYAARGDLAQSRKWLSMIEPALAHVSSQPESYRMQLHRSAAMAEALLRARERNFAEAVRILEESLTLRESSADEAARNRVRLLIAFARSQLGEGGVPEEEARALVSAHLASAGRTLPLERWWPELAEFIAAHAPA
jgi:hypothetical protein